MVATKDVFLSNHIESHMFFIEETSKLAKDEIDVQPTNLVDAWNHFEFHC